MKAFIFLAKVHSALQEAEGSIHPRDEGRDSEIILVLSRAHKASKHAVGEAKRNKSLHIKIT